MIEPNILAFQNAAVLEALDETQAVSGIQTVVDLAKRVGRDESNLRKTLKHLTAEGFVAEDALRNGLTEAGRDQLNAFRRAKHGGERRKAKGRWSLDKFRRNPSNRRIDPEAVLGLADAITGVGDILVPLIASMPDADGIRTIWAGERRWVAATRLAQTDALPPALLEGLPFNEREADAGEAALITLVENGARTDLTPWEDAKQLRFAADATGLNATELARRIGRAREGDRGGVRDVQTKLKVAREATPEAIAAYEADPSAPGAWEALRNSVADRSGNTIVTTKPQRLALAELLHKAGGTPGVDVRILPAGHATEGQRLAQYGLAILTRDPAGDTARVTPAGLQYLQAEGLDGSIENARQRLGFPEGYGVARYRTEWLNTATAAVETPATDARPDPEVAALGGIEPITTAEDLGERIAEKVATYTMANPRRPSGSPLLRIEIGRHADGTWSFATGSHTLTGEGSSYGLSFIDARKRALPDERTALIAAINELRAKALDRSMPIGEVHKRTAWLDDVLALRKGPDGEVTDPPADPLVVNGIRYPNATRAAEARRLQGLEKSQANYGGGGDGARRAPVETGTATSGAPTLQGVLRAMTDAALSPDANPGTHDVPDAEEAKAEATLAEVRAFITDDGARQAFGGWRFRQLLTTLDLAGPFVPTDEADDPDQAGVVWDAKDQPVATCDVHGDLPHDAARAQAELLAYALNITSAMGANIAPGAASVDWPDAPKDETPDQAVVRIGSDLLKILGDPATTVAGDEDLLAELTRQFTRTIRNFEQRLRASDQAAA